MAASSYYSAVQKAYIAFYGRPADPAGLTYWATRIDAAGGNISSIIQAFGTSAEATELYGSLGNAAAVNALYQQIFGRDADITGLNYYVGKLLDGSFTLVDIAQRVIDGASGADATIVANKLTAAQNFTDALDTAAEIIGYTGTSAANTAREWLGTVTSTTASLTAAQGTLAATTSALADAGGEAAAAVSLTTSIDAKVGTGANDVFEASDTNSGATLNTGDSISGGAGNDRLNIQSQGEDPVFTLNSVETVSVRLLSAAAYDVTMWSGVDSIQVAADSVADKSLSITNAATTTEFVARGDVDALRVDFLSDSSSTDSVNFRVINAGVSATERVTLDASAAAITTVNLAASGTNFVDLQPSATNNVNVSGAGTLTLNVNGGDQVSALSLANFSGTTSVSLSGAAYVTITGSNGNDTIKFGDENFAGDVVDGNGGTDTLDIALSGNSNATLSAVSDVESLKFRASGSTVTLDFSGLTFTDGVTLTNATAAVDLSLRQMSGLDVTIATQATALGDITLDYLASGDANLTLVSGGGNQFISGLTVTDADSFALTVTGGTTFSAGNISLEDTVADVTVALGGSAALQVNTAFGVLASGATSLAITANGSASFTNAGILNASGLDTLTLVANSGPNGSISLASAGANLALNSGAITVDVTASGGAGVNLPGITLGSQTGAATVNVHVGDGSNFGAAGNGFDYTGKGSLALTATVGQSGEAYFSAITMAGSATVATLDVTVGASSTFALADLSVEEITAVNFSGTGSANAITLISAASGIGDITIANLQLSAAAIVATSAIGDITITGTGNKVTLTSVVAEQIGDVTVGGSGSTVNMNGTSGIGNITITGSGSISVDVGSAGQVGTVDTTGALGTAVVDLGSAVGALTINLGTGYNDITVGKGGADITLEVGTGHDDLIAIGSAGSNVIEISNFQLASATDRLGFYTAGFDFVNAAGTAADADETAASLSVTLISADGNGVVTLGSAGSIVILRSGTFTDISDVITQMGSAGTHYLKVGTAMSAGAGEDLLVAWTDTAGDTYVTLLNGLSAVAGGSIFGNVQGTIEYDHLFKLNNVDIGSYSGAAFTDKFFTI